ncbi:MAG: energy-coupled thiamine transporter ThiT [Clostridia bacterium]|nr:energy-coupled thiamine transporter ThiT [Clostridia bacterium]
MFLYSLLEVSEKATNTVKWISVGAVVVLLALVALVGFFNKRKFDAKRLAFAGVAVGMSFALALIKVKPVQYGGSVTLASFAPVLLYAYVYGPLDGVIVGLIHGLLNFIESPYILTPATFILDYLLAFAGIGLMGFFGKMKRKEKSALPVVLGCVCVFSARFVSHLLSGMIFFLQDAVWVSLPNWAMGNAFTYSLIYQCVYVPLDALIATIALVALAKTGVLAKLVKQMQPKKNDQ